MTTVRQLPPLSSHSVSFGPKSQLPLAETPQAEFAPPALPVRGCLATMNARS